jgi:predicted alpha/beta-fold hydrolase
MDSDELLAGAKTPPRGSLTRLRQQQLMNGGSPGEGDRNGYKESSTNDEMGGSGDLKATNDDDEDFNNGEEVNTSSEDDESFVTMEEMEEGRDTDIDSSFYAKLGYEDMATDNARRRRPSKVILKPNNRDQDYNVDNSKSFHQDSSFRRMSHHLSREFVRRRSSFIEALPETPAGWSVLVSGLASALLGYELHLQQSLSCPPWVFGQCGASYSSKEFPLQPIFEKLTETPDSLLSRPINPSLFVGTRGTMSSVAAYALWGPPPTDQHLAFRQVITMSADGAKIALDWELPPQKTTTGQQKMTDQQRRAQVTTKGGIHKPVILISTGMNNDTSFGYIKSLQRTFTDRGWIAVAMNFRGCGGVKLATPRCYNGGYTGDIRGVVQYLASRLAPSVPLFLVGNSLSANLVTKYLGEEGLSGTLPSCVAGGVALGNPLQMHVKNLSFPWKEVLALGVKKDLLLNWPTFRHMTVPSFRQAIYNTLKAGDIGEVDEALAPIFIRNDSLYPFPVRIGYKNAEDYWLQSSSFKYIKHISVPCLQIVAGDDMLIYKAFQKRLAQCIQNPYVMCVETKCGGHLGWQESPPDSNAFGVGTSWADRATADFFDAILQTGTFNFRATTSPSDATGAETDASFQPHKPSDDSVEWPRFRSKL